MADKGVTSMWFSCLPASPQIFGSGSKNPKFSPYYCFLGPKFREEVTRPPPRPSDTLTPLETYQSWKRVMDGKLTLIEGMVRCG